MEDVDFKKLEKKITDTMENKWYDLFCGQASYQGNGVYIVAGTNMVATDTRDLFLLFVAARENIKIPYIKTPAEDEFEAATSSVKPTITEWFAK
jgi:hypothetical protein